MKEILKTAIIIFTFLSSSIAIYAQTAKASTDGEKNQKSEAYPPGIAWKLSAPLGLPMSSTMDTLLYNYQRSFVQALGSDAWATTGQFTGPSINMIYFQRPQRESFIFANALSYWLPSFSKQKFYNVHVPYTQLSYGMGYGNEVRTDNLKATFAGNINKEAGIGAWVDYPYTKGAYANQSAKGLGFGLSGYYLGPRYEMQTFFNHYNHLNKENGGITDDRYITDPASLQGGVADIEPKSIPVNLTSAHSRLIGAEFYMSHAYNVGFWEDTTAPGDTVETKHYVPVTRFIYAFDWQYNHHLFLNQNPSEGAVFWKNTFFDPDETRDNDYYWAISNTVGVEMVEGFRKWAKFGLSAYLSYQIDKYRFDVQGLDFSNGTLPDSQLALIGSERALHHMHHKLWAGGRIAKSKGSVIKYGADAKFGLTDDIAGDIDINGFLTTRIPIAKDTMQLKVDASFSNLEPDYLLKHYIGNHFIWSNDFGKTRSIKVQGQLDIPWTRTKLSVGFENIQNQVYFGAESMPSQYSGHIQVVSASIEQKLKAGIWNWNNRATWQSCSEPSVIPLPTWAIYSNMFLGFKAFRRLEVQVGIDCNWYSKYIAPAYQPATMIFHSQGEDPVKVGGYLFSDVYLTAKLYDVRFFVMCSHLNQGWFSRDYFSLPHYPVDPRQLRLGLSIEFSN